MSDLLEVVSPVGVPTSIPSDPAPSISCLNGKTICELWNHAFGGDKTFPFFEESIRRRYPEVKFVSHTEFGNLHGVGPDAARLMEELPQKLRDFGCDAVISGNGG